MASIEQTRNKAASLQKRCRDLLAYTLTTVALCHQYAHAQTFAEWFSQKKTQRSYLLQQIAALNTYRVYAVNGYSIAKGGLGSIGGHLGNEYGLHQSYYQHLSTVNSAVKNDPKIKDILAWQQDIITQVSSIEHQNGLTTDEHTYTVKVCNSLLQDCDSRLNDLNTVLTDNKTNMSDEERLRQINRLHLAMQENYRFASSFSNQLKIYALQKQQAGRDINTLKGLYEGR